MGLLSKYYKNKIFYLYKIVYSFQVFLVFEYPVNRFV